MKAYKNKQLLILVSIFAVAATGCATGPRLGSVTKVVSEKEAEIYVGKSKTSVGDRVVFYAEECSTSGIGRSARRQCTKSRRGEAQITQVNAEGTAMVTSSNPVDLKGYIKVERVMSHTESFSE